MPRITPLRIVLFPILCYIALVLLYIAIPSIAEVDEFNSARYHQDILRAGKRLTTAYENRKIYDSPRNEGNYDRSWFAIDWQMGKNEEDNSIYLKVGSNTTFDLTSLALAWSRTEDPFVTDVTSIIAKSGDVEGVMMPWFQPADCVLLNWEVEKDPKIIDVRVLVRDNELMHVCPESDFSTSDPNNVPVPISCSFPFMTISKIPSSREKPSLREIRINGMTRDVPTITLPIRRWILMTLKPVTLNVVELLILRVVFPAFGAFFWGLYYMFRIAMVGSLLLGFLLGFWSCAGRPPFRPWLRNVVTLRWRARIPRQRAVYGPGGIIGHIEDTDEFQYEYDDDEMGARNTSTLRSPLDFFQSRSPLDDLLNTFESTKWMTQPLGSSRVQRRNRFGPSQNHIISVAEDNKTKMRS